MSILRERERETKKEKETEKRSRMGKVKACILFMIPSGWRMLLRLHWSYSKDQQSLSTVCHLLEFRKPASYSDLSNPSCYLVHFFQHVGIWWYSIINGIHCVCPKMSGFAILPSFPCGMSGAAIYCNHQRDRSTGDWVSTIAFPLPCVASGVQETNSHVSSLHSQCAGEGRAWAVGLDAHGWILTPLGAISVMLGKLLNSTMPRHPHHWGEGSNSTYIIELLWGPMNNMFKYFQKHLEHGECPINNSHGDWYQSLG